MIADSGNMWWGLVLVVMAPWALGEACLVRSSSRGTERFGTALFLGQLIIALATLALFVVGVSFPRIVDAVALLAVVATFGILWLRWRSPAAVLTSHARAPRSFGIFDLVAAACALLLVARIINATASAMTNGDELFIWAAKARHFLHADSYLDALRTITGPAYSSSQQPAHPDYPGLNPLLQAFAMASTPSHPLVVARIPIAIFDLGLLAFLHGAWRRSSWLAASVALSTVFVSTNYLIQDAGADRMLVAGVACAWISLTRWSTGNRDSATLWLFAMGTMTAVWSKNEGQLHLISFALAAFILRAGLERRFLLAWTPALLAIGLMWIVNASVGLTNDLVGGTPETGLSGTLGRLTIDRIWFLFRSFVFEVFLNLGHASGVWVLALIMSVLTPAQTLITRGTWVFVGLSTLGLLLVLGSTPHDITWHWNTAHSRIFLFALPVLAHLVITLQGRDGPQNHSRGEIAAPV